MLTYVLTIFRQTLGTTWSKFSSFPPSCEATGASALVPAEFPDRELARFLPLWAAEILLFSPFTGFIWL